MSLHRVRFEQPGAKFETRRHRHNGMWLRADRGELNHRCVEVWVDAPGYEAARDEAVRRYPDGKVDSVHKGLSWETKRWLGQAGI
jgi:hypothetical protein